jgi:hypothetical protein
MKWKSIYTTNQLFDAELKKSLLAQANINAVIVNKRDSAYGIFGTIHLEVSEEQEAEARQILAENNNEL